MPEIYNPKYLNMPQQVEQNKNDIENLRRDIIKPYYCNRALPQQIGLSIDVDETNFTGGSKAVTPNAILIDTTGSVFQITAYVEVAGISPKLVINYLVSLRGPTGPQGLQGEQGEPGEGFNFMGLWVANNEYYKNDVVTYNNGTTIASYILITEQLNGSATNPQEDTTNWLPLVKVNTANFTIETTHVFDSWTNLNSFVTNLNKVDNQIYSAKLVCTLGKNQNWGVEYEITETYSQANPTPSITFSNTLTTASGFYDGGEYFLNNNTDLFIGSKNYFVKNDNKGYSGTEANFYTNNKTIDIDSNGCRITEFLTSVERATLTVTKKYRARYLYNHTSYVGNFFIYVLKKI